MSKPWIALSRVAIAMFLVFFVVCLARGEFLTAMFVGLSVFWKLLYRQADRRADRIQVERNQAIQQLINHQCPPSDFVRIHDGTVPYGHVPYSQGGIRPHLCYCGKPLEDHR